ncbi:Cationic amino acid transporter, C-terminal,Amino acid/polyamine transporter I [Cinara cedri]|uniref:Cationic amino acid transporter, C-terminal,Amino acid/polyamine transporter I n=1 Tax=Cinara cedri TaxID=506608 RepID=A0A5E4MKY1_9HEMI|nr:Cationic amino acid transporter, C-terminal,Amino acid/polyamine transporter I [Cinara cedri]
MDGSWWNSRENLIQVMSRRKSDEDEPGKEKLARVLDLVDLTALGVGSTLGVGVYVLAGAVAKTDAGPAVVLSFVLAAFASAFAGLCYAEFAARVPRAGSAYVYSYVGVGEFVAFVIGWNLILEYVIGTASVAKGLSNYVDALFDYPIQKTMLSLCPIHVSFMATYPDFLAFSVVLLLSILLSWGVRESTIINNIFTVVNLCTVATVIISGLFKVNSYNWNIPKQDIPKDAKGGEGGFMPYGWAGVTAGAAKCFYGFIGFDTVATTGEEAKRPKRDIPLAIVLSLTIITFAYCGISSVLTLMWPYYKQDADAPFPFVYDHLGWTTIKWIVSSGAIFALFTSLIGTMFPLPRILYAMSCDGLLFRIFADIHPKYHTPVLATLLSGLLAGIMAALFNLEQLIDMMSIGTLLAYSIVCICVLVLRYKNDSGVEFTINGTDGAENNSFVETVMKTTMRYLNLSNIKYANEDTESVSKTVTMFYICVSAVFCFMVVRLEGDQPASSLALYTTAIFGIGLLLLILLLARQPQSTKELSFKVPLVPLIPCLSILLNIYLMMKLDVHTWIRFGIWLSIGFLIYVFYSTTHSVEGQKQRDGSKKKPAINGTIISSGKL